MLNFRTTAFLGNFFAVLESNTKLAALIIGCETTTDISGVGIQHQIEALVFGRETTAIISGVGILYQIRSNKLGYENTASGTSEATCSG